MKMAANDAVTKAVLALEAQKGEIHVLRKLLKEAEAKVKPLEEEVKKQKDLEKERKNARRDEEIDSTPSPVDKINFAKIAFQYEKKMAKEKKRQIYPKGQPTCLGIMFEALRELYPGRYFSVRQISKIFVETKLWKKPNGWSGMPRIHSCEIGDFYAHFDNAEKIEGIIKFNCLNSEEYSERKKDGSILDFLESEERGGVCYYCM